MNSFNFEPLALPAQTAELRREVREFLREELAGMTPRERAHTWQGFDAEFSRKLGARGWIGMTWPREYGGQERSVLERYVVLEELLAAGAPVGGALDRRSPERPAAAALRQRGAARRRYPAGDRPRRAVLLHRHERARLGLRPRLDPHARHARRRRLDDQRHQDVDHQRGPGAPDDRAGAHRKEADSRHAGLSQFIIELSSPGITVQPIVDLTGAAHFSEVFFSDVFVPEEMLLGDEGDGWEQVNAELALERSGPERYLSSYRLLEELVAAAGAEPSPRITELIGELTAELWTLRQMSLSVADSSPAAARPRSRPPS